MREGAAVFGGGGEEQRQQEEEEAMAAARVSIPAAVRPTIKNIKEIAGNHTDEEVYAALRECDMDPNETAQKLLHQGIYIPARPPRFRSIRFCMRRRAGGVGVLGFSSGEWGFSPRTWRAMPGMPRGWRRPRMI